MWEMNGLLMQKLHFFQDSCIAADHMSESDLMVAWVLTCVLSVFCVTSFIGRTI